MKKQLILFSSLLLVGTALALNGPEVQAAKGLPAPAVATNTKETKAQERFYLDSIYYGIVNETEVTVSTHGFDALPETLVIPATVTDPNTKKTYTVTSIERAALARGVKKDEVNGDVQEKLTLKNVTLPNTISYLPESVLAGQSKLEKAVLPNQVTSIGMQAFYGTSALRTLVLPNTLSSIDQAAFRGSGIQTLAIPASVTEIGSYAFAESGLTEAHLPSGLATIAFALFENSAALKTVTIPNSVATIEQRAFSGTGLTAVKLPAGLKEITIGLFKDSPSLTKVEIPDSVVKIWDNAFTGTALTELRIPAGIETWDGFGSNAVVVDTLEKITFTTAIDGGLHKTAIKEPTKKDFSFEGWLTAEGDTYTHAELTSVAMAGNKTVTATWKSTKVPINGQSDATITLRSLQPTGSLSFGDVTKDAKIIFNELTLNGKEQTTEENTALTQAHVVVNDTRSDQTKGWKVSAKYIDTNFSSQKMRLALKPTSTTTTGLNNITLTESDLEVFNDGGKTNDKYDVALKPALTIPADLKVASEMTTQIQWTLTPEVP